MLLNFLKRKDKTMVIFLKNNGDVAFATSEDINLGSNDANSLFVVAPFNSGAAITVAFRLPNGMTLGPGFVENQGGITFDENSGYNLALVSGVGGIPGYSFDGQALSLWRYDIDSKLTEVSGSLGIQLFVFTGGKIISSNLIKYYIGVGVGNLEIPTPTGVDVYQQILNYLSDSTTYFNQQKEEAVAAKTEAEAAATEAQKWATGSYIDENGETHYVTSEDPQFDNNAKYYASEASESEASAIGAKGAAESAKGAAETAAANAAESATNAGISASAAETYLTELKSGIVEPLKKRVDNIDYILEQFGAVIEERDSSVALKKYIPERSDKFAYLKNIRGNTEKHNQLLSNYYWTVGSIAPHQYETVSHNGGTITNLGDGTFLLNGTFDYVSFDLFVSTPSQNVDDYAAIPLISDTGENTVCVSLKNPFPSDVNSPYIYVTERNTVNESGTPINGGYDVFLTQSTSDGIRYAVFGATKKYASTIAFGCQGGTFENYIFAPMFNHGSNPLPWQSPADSFEGLRSAKVEEFKVYGKDLFNAYDVQLKANNSGRVKPIDRNTFIVSNFYTFFTLYPKAGVYRLLAQSERSGDFGGGLVVRIYGSNGSELASPYWDPDKLLTLESPISFTCDGTERRVEFLFYGSGSSGGSMAIFKNVSILHNKTELTPTVIKIPDGIKALGGYGECNPDNANECNLVDFENQTYKKYGELSNGSWVPLSTPSVRDISTELKDFDPVFAVEPNGSLEFVNSKHNKETNNTLVPSTIVYNIIQEG